MGFVSFSLPALFEQAFGYKSTAFEFAQVEGTEGKLAKGDDVYSNKIPKYSSTGAGYFSTDDFGREYYMPVMLGDVELSHPVISVVCRKNIVETPLVNRRGTVKEVINKDDYHIAIRGLIISKDNAYPEAKVRQLKELFDKDESLSMVCAISDIFLLTPDRAGYDNVVIRSMDFPPMVGVMNVRAYSIDLVSDEAFSLIEL